MSNPLYNFSIVENMEYFLAGLAGQFRALDEADLRTISSNLSTYNTILTLQSRLREVYDQYVPNVHVLDINVVTDLAIENIKSKPGYYIAFKKVVDADDITQQVKDDALNQLVTKLSDKSGPAYVSLKSEIRSAVLKYWRSIRVPGNNPIAKLNELSQKIIDFQNRTSITKVEAVQVGQNFATEIKAVFGNRAILGVYDKDLGSSSDVYIFFGKSFEAMKGSINKPVSDVIKQEFTKIIKKDLLEGINVGFVVNFGHAMVVSMDGAQELGRFVNSPGFATSVYGIASATQDTSKIAAAAAFYKDESGLVTNKLQFQKNFQTKTDVLMRLGITFTFPEDWDINQTRGREQEGPAKLSLLSATKRKISTQDKVSFIKFIVKVLRKEVLTDNPENASSSKTLKQYLRSVVFQLLRGEKVTNEKADIVRVKSVPLKRRKIVLNQAAKKQLNLKNPRVTKPKVQIKSIPTTRIADPALNTVNLQSLINSGLYDQIRKNMGSGNRTDVLNFRSGRFAESVKVERISKSREGMITAFYSYMKNPYSTFSRGGRQERPLTRDPKLLIAKSIREIAQTMVTNRLRAVNV